MATTSCSLHRNSSRNLFLSIILDLSWTFNFSWFSFPLAFKYAQTSASLSKKLKLKTKDTLATITFLLIVLLTHLPHCLHWPFNLQILLTHFLNLPILHSWYSLFSSYFSDHSLGFYLLISSLCLITPESAYIASLELPCDLLVLFYRLSSTAFSFLSSWRFITILSRPSHPKSLCSQN